MTDHKEIIEQCAPVKLKAFACSFYRWWHNQPGTNTEQGYDDWLAEITKPKTVMINGVECIRKELKLKDQKIAELQAKLDIARKALGDVGYHQKITGGFSYMSGIGYIVENALVKLEEKK